MAVGRILALVFGSLGALVAIVLIVSGGFLLWFDSAKTDAIRRKIRAQVVSMVYDYVSS